MTDSPAPDPIPAAAQPQETAASPRAEFKLHRSGLPQGGAVELPRPLKRMLAVSLVILVLGVAFAARYELGLVERPRPLPVLPAVVDAIALGMTPEEVRGLGERLPKHRGDSLYVGASGDPQRPTWRFYGYPRDFPAGVNLGEAPELEGTLRFSDGRVAALRVVHPGHGPEVSAVDVIEGLLEEVERRLKDPAAAPLRLDDVQGRLGFGRRAGRLLEAGAPHPELDLYRWSYPWLVDGRLGELKDLDLLVTPDGRVVGQGAR